MTESYLTGIETVEGVSAPKGVVNLSDDPLVARIEQAMAEIGVAEANTKAEEAILEGLIQSKLVDESDPFIAMMNAMLIVIPQLMKCKEELLVEKTANYDYISSVNAYMAEAQQNFAQSAEKSDPVNQGGFSTGTTTGLAFAKAYEGNLTTIQQKGLFDGMAPETQKILYEAIGNTLGLEALTPDIGQWKSASTKKQYNLTETLWAGLNSPEWTFDGENTDRYTNKGYADPTGTQDLFVGHNKTAASYLGGQLGPVVSDAVTQNTIIENTLNGYSKQTEASYKFEMENYNSIVNTDAQMYQAQLNQNRAHTSRLRAL